jgi:hypothetical protein
VPLILGTCQERQTSTGLSTAYSARDIGNGNIASSLLLCRSKTNCPYKNRVTQLSLTIAVPLVPLQTSVRTAINSSFPTANPLRNQHQYRLYDVKRIDFRKGVILWIRGIGPAISWPCYDTL